MKYLQSLNIDLTHRLLTIAIVHQNLEIIKYLIEQLLPHPVHFFNIDQSFLYRCGIYASAS